MSDPEPEFVTVARVGEIAEGSANVYTLGERLVAVFNIGGEYQAIDDLCPHMGASLAGGWVEQGTVTCPWHAWRFRLCDGTWCDNPRIKTDSFDVRLIGDEIQVSAVPRKRTPPPTQSVRPGP